MKTNASLTVSHTDGHSQKREWQRNDPQGAGEAQWDRTKSVTSPKMHMPAVLS